MLTFLKAWFTTRVAPHLPKDEKGQDAAEYALLIALIAVVIIGAVAALGGQITAAFTAVGAAIGAGAP
jgi:pilus assembly protein Flp/PilA